MKAPNLDSKKHRQARNCWNCDNGDWQHMRHAQCICKERSRAANKERTRKEVEKEILELIYCHRYYPFCSPIE